MPSENVALSNPPRPFAITISTDPLRVSKTVPNLTCSGFVSGTNCLVPASCTSTLPDTGLALALSDTTGGGSAAGGGFGVGFVFVFGSAEVTAGGLPGGAAVKVALTERSAL